MSQHHPEQPGTPDGDSSAFAVRIDRYLDDAMDDREVRAFSAELLENADKRAVFRAVCEQHQMLLARRRQDNEAGLVIGMSGLPESSLGTCDEDEQPLNHLDTNTLTRQKYASALSYVLRHTFTPKRMWVFGTAAALLLGVVLAIVLFTSGPEEPQPIVDAPEPPGSTDEPINQPVVVATLTAERDAVWDHRPSQDLYAGQRFTLIRGYAEITTRHGAVAVIDAPATFELIDSPNALYLHAGRLVGICESESSKGFLVRTPQMDVTDLGTRFGVDLSTPEGSEVHVFDGEVKIGPNRADSALKISSQILGRNMAIKVSAQGDVEYLDTAEADLFVSSMTINPLLGTGVGLSVGQTDPNWQVVAIDGQDLPRPLPLVVSDNIGHVERVQNDAGSAQWVAYSSQTQSSNLDNLYTIEAAFMIDDTVDLEQAELRGTYYADDYLQGVIRVNGIAVSEPLEGRQAKASREASFVVNKERAVLRHGINRVSFDISNKSGTPLGLYLDIHLVPKQTQIEN